MSAFLSVSASFEKEAVKFKIEGGAITKQGVMFRIQAVTTWERAADLCQAQANSCQVKLLFRIGAVSIIFEEPS